MKAFIDGNAICIVRDDFVNLQESDAVFVYTVPDKETWVGELEETVKALNELFAGEKK